MYIIPNNKSYNFYFFPGFFFLSASSALTISSKLIPNSGAIYKIFFPVSTNCCPFKLKNIPNSYSPAGNLGTSGIKQLILFSLT